MKNVTIVKKQNFIIAYTNFLIYVWVRYYKCNTVNRMFNCRRNVYLLEMVNLKSQNHPKQKNHFNINKNKVFMQLIKVNCVYTANDELKIL